MQTSRRKIFALLLLIIFLQNILLLPVAQALSGGPGQPEVQSFEPVGTSQMVDLSTGMFTYNIPLMEIDGYPLNLFYHSGITMDQEASCVGLGWNLNPGAVNRNVRGLPDDFNGDEVTKEMNVKKDLTYGFGSGVNLELFGLSKAKLGLSIETGVFYNNYRGLGLEFGLSPSLKVSKSLSDGKTMGLGSSLNFNINSQQGVSSNLGISPCYSVSETNRKKGGDLSLGLTGGLGFNSKSGLKVATISPDIHMYAKNHKVDNPNKPGEKMDFRPGGRVYSTGNSAYSFAVPCYNPAIPMAMNNFSLSVHGTFGGELFGINPGILINGYYSENELKDKQTTSRSIGTMYLEQATKDNVLDFNREKDGPFTPYVPNLALVVPTPDIYAVSGQGIGGSYLLKRSDVGVFYDKRTESKSNSVNFSGEFGLGNSFKAGADISVIHTSNIVEKWNTKNNLAEKLAFHGRNLTTGDPLDYENVYFKQAGDLSVEEDEDFLTKLGGVEPVSAVLDDGEWFNTGTLQDHLSVGINGIPVDVGTDLHKRTKREKRNQDISYLTAEEASHFGLLHKISNYPLYSALNKDSVALTNKPFDYYSSSGYRKAHHIGEIRCINEDGKQYVYGIPAYNVTQSEFTFSVARDKLQNHDEMVPYVDQEATTGNTSGKDNFFSKETTPAHAHSYLLTAILSSDYQDVDEVPGPSLEDLGNYTLIKYHRQYEDLKWRVPIYSAGDQYANYNEGLYCLDNDNKAIFVYGEKEYWYVNSIEGKEHIAQFFYSERKDGLGVACTGGDTIDTQRKLLELDSIRLMSKTEMIAKGSNAIPDMVVHFEYDNSLCKGVYNVSQGVGTTGKLSLKRLYFTYGGSKRGSLNNYRFNYGKTGITADGNPDYSPKAYSRWGNYQAHNDSFPNTIFPYVIQNKYLQDQNAYAWNLTSIELPSGGRIQVDYESHDYAYVQDRPAMQMMRILGTGTSPQCPAEFTTCPAYLFHNGENYNYLFFRLTTPCTDTGQVYRYYIKDIKDKYLYFRCFTQLNSLPTSYDFVTGYAKIKSAGLCTENPNVGYIELSPVTVKDDGGGEMNPIAKAAWQFMRIYAPDLIYDHTNANESEPTGLDGFVALVNAMKNLGTEFSSFVEGPNNYMKGEGFGSIINTCKSWIRLYNPDGYKLAGGSRVKRITVSDNWKTMTQNSQVDSTRYGQEYFYTTTEQTTSSSGPITRTISSGVASYEPILGGDENPFHTPDFYKEKHLLAPDNRFYQEYPIGESFFPSPQIVYSKVIVKNLKFTSGGALTPELYTSTGTTVNEYYTAKDFPTIAKKTPLDKVRDKTSPIFTLFKITNKDYETASQGFSVENNDMHGKPKAQWSYGDNGQRISGVEYIYKTDGNKLDNKVKVIDPTGTVTEKELGVEIQTASDARQSRTTITSAGVALNTDGFMASVFPFIAILPYPIYEKEETMFRSMSISKVINRSGLLIKTNAYDATSQITTENLAFDSQTGDLLLSKTFNEFKDPVYTFRYPAHWAYDGMKQSFLNSGIEANGSINGFDLVLSSGCLSGIGKFFPGDEVALSLTNAQNTTYQRGWLLGQKNSNTLVVCDSLGQDFDACSNTTFKVLRSGHRNMQTSEIEKTVLQFNPIVSGQLDFDQGSETGIINSNATEYSDKWQYGCPIAYGSLTVNGSDVNVINPFLSGQAGDWRVKDSYTALADRHTTLSPGSTLTNIRSDGSLIGFSPFWVFHTNKWIADPSSSWQWNEKLSKVNMQGLTLESMDPLLRYESQLPDQQNLKIISTASNCRMRESTFQSFEKNYYSRPLVKYPCPCELLALQFIDSIYYDTNHYHTGYRSLKVSENLDVCCSTEPDTNFTYRPSQDALLEGINTFPPTQNPPTLIDYSRSLGGPHLDIGKEYILMAWVRVGDNLNTVFTSATLPKITLGFCSPGCNNTFFTVDAKPSGEVIDGWGRIYQVFTVPAQYTKLKVTFIPSTLGDTYFDDFRIQPFNSSMKYYLFDSRTRKLSAELDENNYATFFEYDKAGNLERIKKETEKGVMTIKEIRAHHFNN